MDFNMHEDSIVTQIPDIIFGNLHSMTFVQLTR